jgi:hypothetical protein
VPAGASEAACPSAVAAVAACRRVNEALLHRVATGRPFSIWKYAMTLDGKIATRSGHSAWVSGALACKHDKSLVWAWSGPGQAVL